MAPKAGPGTIKRDQSPPIRGTAGRLSGQVCLGTERGGRRRTFGYNLGSFQEQDNKQKKPNAMINFTLYPKYLTI